MVGMQVTVLLFASVADRLGTRRTSIELPEGATVGSARDELVERYPQLAPFLPTMMYAVNEEYVREGSVIPAGATLALIPPVSGG